MIGQEKHIRWIEQSESIPKFIVLVGPRGSGKTMLAKLLANKLHATLALCGVKVDEVRTVIDTAYSARENIVYCIKDADTMRNEAKNAMLKITEEPPANAWFVITVCDDSSLLNTIRSRATVLLMQPYTQAELLEYYKTRCPLRDDTHICKIATTPYEVDMLLEYGNEFLDYVSLVRDNIGLVMSANAFKSASKLALKNEEDKFDLKLFWRTFIWACYSRLTRKDCEAILVTSKYINKVDRLGVNKSQLYDSWVFDIRRVLYEDD